ncbi:MAG: helix-turn-helix domain-containing protein [Myxococcales bacterium]|nr:helix-turn-helix domain-containing protein [Myxococcales bacterium]
MGELELWVDPAATEAEDNGSDAEGRGASRARPRSMVVAGARGGVGKSLVAANLGVYLATIGRRVVVVDADPSGANAHAYLGAPRFAGATPDLDPVRPTGGELAVRWTDTSGLGHLLAGTDEPLPGATRTTATKRLRAFVEGLDADFVVVDLGSGLHGARLDWWLDGDASIYITVPDPAAMENTYAFVRRAFARTLLRATPDAPTRARMLDWLRKLGNTPAPTDLGRRLDAAGDSLSDLLREQTDKFRFAFALNATRTREDLELGDAMRVAMRRRLGLMTDYLGYMDHDDGVAACARLLRPLLVESPGSKAAKSLEKIARRLLASAVGRTDRRSVRPVPMESHHDLLEVGRMASDEEVRRAYKRVKEVFRPESLCCFGLFDAAALRVINARLDEAYDVLLDPSRRAPYETSVFPPEPNPLVAEAIESELADPPPPAPLITPETDFSGSLLRAVRESQGVSLGDIAQRTKVGLHHLESIESEDFAHLPAPVYVRGFVTELAKCLRLDVSQVSRTYLRRYKQYIQEQAAR